MKYFHHLLKVQTDLFIFCVNIRKFCFRYIFKFRADYVFYKLMVYKCIKSFRRYYYYSTTTPPTLHLRVGTPLQVKKSRWNYLNLLSVSLKIQFCIVHHLKKNNRLSVPPKSLCTLDPLRKKSRIVQTKKTYWLSSFKFSSVVRTREVFQFLVVTQIVDSRGKGEFHPP